MKIAVISDVHSNLTALEAVRADMFEQGVEEVHCLGDTIGYGPYPLECLHAVLDSSKTVLKGNHEDAVCNPSLCDDLNRFATEGINFSRSKLTPEIIEGLSKFPLTKVLPEWDMVLCHGAFSHEPAWRYIDCPYKAKEEIKVIPNRLCVIGHTHSPCVYGGRHGLIKFLPESLELPAEEKFVINVGSVGQPRDGDCRSSYGIFNLVDGKMTFHLRKVFYDISKVDKAIRAAGISPELAERLYSGD
jgi:predicted phosphodiesterase